MLVAALSALVVSTLGGWILRQSIQTTLLNNFQQRLEEKADRLESGFFVIPGEQRVRWQGRGNDEFSRIFSGWYWQLAGDPDAPASRSLWDSRLDLKDAVRHPGQNRLLEIDGPQAAPLLGIVRHIRLEDRVLELHVFGPATDITSELTRLDRILLLTQFGLIVVLLLTSMLQVRLGLRPLHRLRQRLGAVRTGDASDIGKEYGPELTPLAEELDLLLTRNARIVDRARSHTADLSHALKKPLALLAADEGLKRHPLLCEQISAMSQLIDRHLARAGSGAGSHRMVPVGECIDKLSRLMQRLYKDKHLAWHIECPARLLWRGEQTDLEEMLGNLLDNAGKWASTAVIVDACRQHDEIVITVSDDGPGLSAEQISETGVRGRRFDESTEGSGLGLAITGDIASTYGGELVLNRGPQGGLLACLRLPG